MTENVCKLLDNLSRHNSRAYGYELSQNEILQILKLFDDVKELEQYRAIGTVRQVQDFITDWRKFRELGNLEELKALKEKSVAKKPILSKSMMTKREFQICPVCERLVLYDGIKFNYCQYCGQKLDWQ